MYSKMFKLINDGLNSILQTDITSKSLVLPDITSKRLELKKIEIKGIKVKFVFLDRELMTVKTRLYEMDLFCSEPKLILKKEYLKPFKDKYFR